MKLVAHESLTDWFMLEPYSGTGQPEGTSDEWRDVLALAEHMPLDDLARLQDALKPIVSRKSLDACRELIRQREDGAR